MTLQGILVGLAPWLSARSPAWSVAMPWIGGNVAVVVGFGMLLGYFEVARRRARESEELFRSQVFDSPDAIMLFDPRISRFCEVNPSAERLFGLDSNALTSLDPGNLFESGAAGTAESRPRFRQELEAALRSEGGDFPNVAIEAAGNRRYADLSIHPVVVGGRLFSRLDIVDMTERRQAEDQLRRSNRALRAISSCRTVILRAIDEHALLSDICRIMCEEIGYVMAWVGFAEHDEEQTVRPIAWCGFEDRYLEIGTFSWGEGIFGRGPTGTAIRTGRCVYVQDFRSDPRILPWRDKALQRGYRSSISLPLADESESVFGAITLYQTTPDAFNDAEISLLESLSKDVAFGVTSLRSRSARRLAEEELRNNLRDKTKLLQELYHRTRNNMSMVISLLSLQAEAFDDGDIRDALVAMQDRIFSMALVHDQLYRSQDLSRLNLREYLEDLVAHFGIRFGLAERGVRFDLALEDVVVLVDVAIPCGLILNELITNSAKHAFPDKYLGTIRLELRREVDRIRIDVCDDGVGAPADFATGLDDGFGLGLVSMLVTDQLKGHVRIEPSPGFRCFIEFDDSIFRPRV